MFMQVSNQINASVMDKMACQQLSKSWGCFYKMELFFAT